MKKAFVTFLVLVMMEIATIAQDNIPTPATSTEGTEATLEIYFPYIQQGHTGLIRVTGENIQSVSATLFNAPLYFFTVDTYPGYFALISVDFEQTQRVYELAVTITHSSGVVETLTAEIDVESGNFIQQDVTLTGEQSALVDETIETNELNHISAIVRQITPEKLWDASGFQLPIDAELTSPFGAVRVFNNFLRTRHTGWDLQAQIGRAMRTTAAGRVAFAGRMDIRGNYVLIDHGHGIFSGYAHLSVIYVTQGQRISAGQIIGQVGSTGRSSSAHAHFEMLVNGLWVDAADFLSLWLP